MEITFGKHSGKSIEMMVLKEPDYIHWMLSQTKATGPMATAQKEARHLIAIFDQKSFAEQCKGVVGKHKCGKTAVRCTVYNINVFDPFWWCDSCDPYQYGANRGKLQTIITYEQALLHVDRYCNSSKSDYQSLILSLAKAKGLPTRVGNAQAIKFFTQTY